MDKKRRRKKTLTDEDKAIQAAVAKLGLAVSDKTIIGTRNGDDDSGESGGKRKGKRKMSSRERKHNRRAKRQKELKAMSAKDSSSRMFNAIYSSAGLSHPPKTRR